MALKAKSPEEIKVTKPKFMISGRAKVGKTTFSLQFPKPYFIDTEGGAVREQYTTALKKSGGVYLGKDEGSQDFKVIIDQVKELTTTKHDYKTLVIDSFSYLYLLEAAAAEEKGGSDYGRDKKEANKPTRQLIKALEKLDMTVIIICHSKDKWEKKPGKNDERVMTGTTFDGWEKLDYIYDLWIEIMPGGKTFMVKGSRMTAFPEGESFPTSYERFSELYGKEIIEKDSTPVAFANYAQLVQIKDLIEGLNVTEEQQAKVLKTFDAEKWEDLTEAEIQKCIESLQKKAKALTGEGQPKAASEPAPEKDKEKKDGKKKS